MTLLDSEVATSERELEDLGPRSEFVPTVFGPVWRRDGDGDFLMPDFRLTGGPQVIGWIVDNMRGPDGPWVPTFEQARLFMWHYAVRPVDLDDEEDPAWLYRDTVIQKVKGWGKDPVAAVMCGVELCGPSRPVWWKHPDGTLSKKYLEGSQIIFDRLTNEPWIQIFGVAKEQTVNTMNYLQGLFTDEAKKKYQIEVNRSIIYAFGYLGKIEAVTSAPSTREGNRPSLVVKNEPHHWRENNDGWATAAVIDRNVNKMRGPIMKRARTLSVTNAYDPSEESHAQSVREAYDDDLARGVEDILYDSIEAPEDVPLLPDYTYLDEQGHRIKEWQIEAGTRVMVPPSRQTVIEYLGWLLRHLRGDAVWLSPIETAKDILKTSSDMAEMRRFYTNAIVTGESNFVVDSDLTATIHPMLRDARLGRERGDVLRLGWAMVGIDEPVVMFFDGSKSGDSTALVGCRVSDGYLFLIGLWEKPRGKRGDTWLSPRNEVDARVREAFRTFNIVAFWADPSHAKDDVDGTRYWDGLIDQWHVDFADQLTHWARTGGEHRSAIMWDMASPANSALFSQAVVRFADDMDMRDVVWDGHPGLRSHFRNARRFMGMHGMIIRKPGRGSGRKIDAAVCAVGARMLARLVTLQKETSQTGRQSGEVWVPSRFRR